MTNQPEWAEDAKTYAHRVPWNLPYGYRGVQVSGTLSDEERVDIAFEAVAMETAYRQAYGLPAVGESHLVDEAMRQGAVPAQPQRAPQSPQQGSPVDGPLFCKQCSGPAAIRPGAKPMKSRYAPFQMQYPAECQGQCRNPKNPNFPLTTYIDA